MFFGNMMGSWTNKYGSNDGLKFICLDSLHKDIKSGKCLVYSFGLSDNWSFEGDMASLGCKIGRCLYFFPNTNFKISKNCNSHISRDLSIICYFIFQELCLIGSRF